MKEAMYWHTKGDVVRCELCPHRCLIPRAKSGICGVRQNVQGKLMALTYGMVSSMHVDPMEKKPFYHFKPGHTVLSFGSVGCNLGCLHCQNYSISQASPGSPMLNRIEAEEVPGMVRGAGCNGVSWTYNEPTMWIEFASDASKLCKKEGMFTNFVSNGYIQEAPLCELKGVIDAMNIDVKGFTEDFYKMMDLPTTPSKTMERAHQLAKASGLKFVYVGNMRSDAESTFCPDCGSLVIRRSWFDVELVNYHHGRCGKCGRDLHMVP